MKKPFKKRDREKRLIVINSIVSIVILLFGIGFVYFMDDFFVPQYGPRGPSDQGEQVPSGRDEEEEEQEDRSSGCMDFEACNYDPNATDDDSSCDYYISGILSGDLNLDEDINVLDIVIIVQVILGYDDNDLSDINSDGSTNVLDIVQLVGCILAGGGDCMGIINLPPELGEFTPINISEEVELNDYLAWISDNGYLFDVYFSENTLNLDENNIVSPGQSEEIYDPDLINNEIYAWKVIAKSFNCADDDSCCVNDSGVLTFSTVIDEDEEDQGEGEVVVEVTGTAEWQWSVYEDQIYNSYDFGLIERGQTLISSDLGEGRGIEIINSGTVPLNMRLNYTNFLFNSSDSNWQYFSKCIAVNHETGQIEDYVSGDAGCTGEYIQLDYLDIIEVDQPIVTCLKYTTQENPYKPAISIGQSIFISYNEPLGVKDGMIDIKMWATDEELNCTTGSPFDEVTID